MTIAVDHEGTGLLTSRCVNQWLLPSGNALRLSLAHPDDRPSFSLDRSRAAVSVFLAEIGSAPAKPLETYAARRWHVADGLERGEQCLLPLRIVIPFEVPRPPDCRIFREAAEVQDDGALTGDDRREIVAQAEAFRAAIDGARFEEAYEVQRARFEDEARSKGHDPERLKATALKQWAALRRAPDFSAPALALGDSRLQAYPRLRLVGLEAADGGAPVRFTSGGQALGMALYFAKLGGRWVVAR